jgi:hypothetical protein
LERRIRAALHLPRKSADVSMCDGSLKRVVT